LTERTSSLPQLSAPAYHLHRYWDFSYNDYNYSYVRQAVDDKGYSTFAWDRLGIAQSTLFEDPINEGQVWIEIAALKALTDMLRNQQISGISAQFQNIVHVGHSFGSDISYALTAYHPDISDGIVLTGFSQNASFLSQFVLGSNFIIANTISALSKYPVGYLAPNSAIGAHIDFFAPMDFDAQVLQVAYATGQPVTPGEILTLTGAAGFTNTFSGPVLIVTGGTCTFVTSQLFGIDTDKLRRTRRPVLRRRLLRDGSAGS